MNKNKKMLFLAVALVTVLILVSAVNATNDTDKSIDNTISEKTSTQASNIIKEKTTPKEKIETNKNNEIQKTNRTDKNLKKDSTTINGIEYSKIITDQEYNEDICAEYENYYFKNCFINNDDVYFCGAVLTLENCVVDTTSFEGEEDSTLNLINTTFNKRIRLDESSAYCEKINFSEASIYVSGGSELVINNSEVNKGIDVYRTPITFINSRINSTISGATSITIDADTVFYSNAEINCNNIIIDDINRVVPYLTVYNGNFTFENVIINTQKTNRGNVTFINSTLNSRFVNNGNMTISDDTVFGENFEYSGTGNIIINDTSRIIPYMSSFNGFTLENITFNKSVSFRGENKLINCTFENMEEYCVITNEGNLSMINCSINNCNLTRGSGALIANNGNLYLDNISIENNYINVTRDNVNGFIHNALGNNYANLTINEINFSNNYIVNNYNVEGFINCYYKMNIISINNSIFSNNYVSVNNRDGIDYNKYLITNTNNTNISNCIFENNVATAILGSNVNITNSTFRNNTQITNSKLGTSALVTLSGDNNLVTDCRFINNSFNLNNSQAYNSNPSGALSIQNAIISNSVFENNGIECSSIWLTVNGAAIKGSNLIITDNNFTANYINTVKGTSASTESYEFDFSSSGYGVDIYADGTTTITGNNFINSTGNQDVGSIYLNDENSVIEITNNNFSNCKSNKETIAVISENKNIADNTFINCSIGFKTLNLTAPSKVYSNEDVSVSLNVELAYPDNYDADLLEKTDYTWYINGENTTTKDTTKTVSVGTSNVIVYVTPTVSNNRTRVLSLIPTVLTDVVITPENINNYVVMGELQVNPNTKVIFQGTFTDIGEINNNKNEVLFDGSNATFTNTCFTIEGNDNTIQNMNINNKETSNYIIQNSGNNTVIKNNILTQYNTNGQTAAIKDSNSKNTIITQNKITVTGPAKDVMSEGGVRIANTQAILSKNTTQSTITYNNITVNNSTNPELASFTTIEAITAPQSNKNQISYNNIQCTGARFNYGIDILNNVEENEISYNNITATGYRYCDGIQIGDNATNNLIANNNIKITCLNTTPVDEAAISYGIIVTSQGGLKADNNTITQNNIEINGIVNYGIEIYTASNTPITDNTITLTGAKSMGIGYAHSPNSTVTGNTINTNDDSSIPINGITEEIQPLNTGILTQQDSDNILIEDNTIQTYDKQGQDTCIKIESSNVTIKNNNLTSSTQTGDNTITTTQPDTTTIENNNAIQQNSTTQTTTEDLTIGDSTTITAQFYDDTYTPVADGKAIFRVNGKTLRDDQGNVIYADVINGRVELPNVNITQEWTKPDTTIQAVYVGDDNNAPITTTPTTITVTKPEATITLEAPTTANAGQEITLKATVTDGDKQITSGRVAFKLNGKTLKDPKTGKALYANVENGEATITYTIPEKTKAKEYVLTAVFTDTKYDRKDANSTLTVVKS